MNCVPDYFNSTSYLWETFVFLLLVCSPLSTYSLQCIHTYMQKKRTCTGWMSDAMLFQHSNLVVNNWMQSMFSSSVLCIFCWFAGFSSGRRWPLYLASAPWCSSAGCTPKLSMPWILINYISNIFTKAFESGDLRCCFHFLSQFLNWLIFSQYGFEHYYWPIRLFCACKTAKKVCITPALTDWLACWLGMTPIRWGGQKSPLIDIHEGGPFATKVFAWFYLR